MYALIGEKRAHYPEEEDEEEIVALFTDKKRAEDYLEESKLSTYNTFCCRGRHRQFRQKSLLSRFCHAWVEEYEKPYYIVDPEL